MSVSRRVPTLALALLPTLIASLALVIERNGALVEVRRWLGWTPWLLILSLAVPVLIALVGALRSPRESRVLAVRLAPACVAPLAVLYPWTVAPSHLGSGVGGGGLTFFLVWLTKYPTFGPINRDVLLGILCVLGASFGPALTGASVLAGRGFGAFAALFGLSILAYGPVLALLDAPLLLLLAASLGGGNGGVGAAAVGLAGGAILRAAAIVGLSLAAPHLWREAQTRTAESARERA